MSDKLEKDKKNLPEDVVMQVGNKGSEYCLNNNAEQMPDVCNEFLANYLNTWKDMVDVEEMKELTYHFCQWIFFNGYTCSLVKMNANNSKEISLNESNKKDEAEVPVNSISDIKGESMNNKEGKEVLSNVQDSL
jgi:hypothetical protein